MEETTDVSKKSVAIKYGVIGGLVSIILFVIMDFAGVSGNPSLTWVNTVLSLVIFVALIAVGQREFKKNGDGFMSYGEGLGLGTLLSLVSGIISSIFVYVYVSFINSAYIDNIRQQQVESMEKQGMSDAQIEQAMKMAENFSGPIAMLIFGILGSVFFGFVVSLVVSAFTKESRPEFE